MWMRLRGAHVGGTPQELFRGNSERGLLLTPAIRGRPGETKLAALIANERLRYELGNRAAEFARTRLNRYRRQAYGEIYEMTLRRKGNLVSPVTEHLHSDLCVPLSAGKYNWGAAISIREVPDSAGLPLRVFTASPQTGRNDPDTEHVPDPFVTLPRRSVRWQCERAVRRFLLPGEVGTHWSWHACRAARAFLRRHPSVSATIFSTFPPMGSHLAAWQLANTERLPWIADFRDLQEEEHLHGLKKLLYQHLEK